MSSLQHVLTTPELEELTGLIKEVHSFDFSTYTKASLKRRILRIMQMKRLQFDNLKEMLTNNPDFFREFLDEITVNVTEMFRDPSFYKALNSQVIPQLSTYEHIKIWSAGCSSGEEVYSLAILLQGAGLKKRSFIYGTDVNTVILNEARKGTYSLRKVKSYAGNYELLGLKGSITDYFTITNNTADIHPELKHNTWFFIHNLQLDAIFNNLQLISCRNVFIYFESALQEKILEFFYNSLSPLGFLCMGSKETIRSDKFKDKFRVINSRENIYQKIIS